MHDLDVKRNGKNQIAMRCSTFNRCKVRYVGIVSTQGESPIQNLALEISLSTAGEVEEEVEEESPVPIYTKEITELRRPSLSE